MSRPPIDGTDPVRKCVAAFLDLDAEHRRAERIASDLRDHVTSAGTAILEELDGCGIAIDEGFIAMPDGRVVEIVFEDPGYRVRSVHTLI